MNVFTLYPVFFRHMNQTETLSSFYVKSFDYSRCFILYSSYELKNLALFFNFFYSFLLFFDLSIFKVKERLNRKILLQVFLTYKNNTEDYLRLYITY